jgi:hypothetical protein
MSPQREEQSLQLWHTAASQLLGMLDVDNSLARKTDLVNAVSLSFTDFELGRIICLVDTARDF